MQYKGRWIWEAYIILVTGLVIRKVFVFLTPNTATNLYYRILTDFDVAFYFTYCAALLQIIFNTIHLIPLILYVYRIKTIDIRIWQTLLIMRLAFDITGHSYELSHIVAAYHVSPRVAFDLFIVSVSPYFPSYLGCFRYAFQSNKIKIDTNKKPR